MSYVDWHPQSPFVPSDLNFCCFLSWASTCSDEQWQQKKDLYCIKHRRDSSLAAQCPIWPVLVHRPDGTCHQIQERNCMDVGCYKCFYKQGGFRFPWLGAWTCIRGVGSSLDSSLEIRERWLTCANPNCPILEHAKTAPGFYVLDSLPAPAEESESGFEVERVRSLEVGKLRSPRVLRPQPKTHASFLKFRPRTPSPRRHPGSLKRKFRSPALGE